MVGVMYTLLSSSVYNPDDWQVHLGLYLGDKYSWCSTDASSASAYPCDGAILYDEGRVEQFVRQCLAEEKQSIFLSGFPLSIHICFLL